MFRLSKASEYAIRGLLYLSENEDRKIIDILEISRAQDAPSAYLAKLFQTLVKKGFVKSVRGPEGGFSLLKRPSEIRLLDVIEAFEGKINLNDCLIRKGQCGRDEICPVHDVWKTAQISLLEHLKNSYFDKLAEESKRKKTAAQALQSQPKADS